MPIPGGSEQKEKRTILAIDDEAMILKLLTISLEDNYNLLTASTGTEAINLCMEHSGEISLVIVDRCLDDIDGFDLRKQITNITGSKPFVMISGDMKGMEDVGETSLGPIAYMQKPFRVDDLNDRIESLLDK